MLDQIKVVMVQTWHPGNIGAAARAMKTMGIHDLWLVSPRVFPSDEANALAAGALDVVENATIVDSLDEAISDCSVVVATSARSRSHPWPMLTAREFGEQHAGPLNAEKIAVVFGPETSGLDNDALRKCHYHVEIPSNPDYGVLNVSSAVQVVCYELYMAEKLAQDHEGLGKKGDTGNDKPRSKPKPTAARQRYPNNKEMEHFYGHLEQTLDKAGFIVKAHPGKAMLRLKRLFTRARPEKTELNMLQGILSSMNKIMDRSDNQNN